MKTRSQSSQITTLTLFDRSWVSCKGWDLDTCQWSRQLVLIEAGGSTVLLETVGHLVTLIVL